MTEKLGQVSGEYFIDEVFPDGGRTLRWEQHYDVVNPWAVDKEAPWRESRDAAFEEMARLRREEGGEYRLYHQPTHLIYEVKGVDITDAEDFTVAQRLAKLAQIAEWAARRNTEERLMPAKGVANLVWEALSRIEQLEQELEEQRTENQ